jgi:hypothetical protein
LESYDSTYYRFPVSLNIKDILLLTTKSPAAILTINRSKTILPLRDISIIDSSKTKDGHFKIGVSRVGNPLELAYLPEILDTYPQDDHISPGIAMFAFPISMKFKKNSDLPKWFSFVLTDEMGNRSYASCLIFTEEAQKITYEAVYLFKNSWSLFIIPRKNTLLRKQYV